MRESLPDLLALAGTVAGWSLVTLGLVLAFSASWLWYLSAGLFIMAAVGLRPLGRILFTGLYGAHAEEEAEKEETRRRRARDDV